MMNTIPINIELLNDRISLELFGEAGVRDFSYNKISLTNFMSSIYITCPKLKYHRDGIFAEWLDEASIDLWIEKIGDIERTEIILNRLTIMDSFNSVNLELDSVFANNVADCIECMWRQLVVGPSGEKISVGIDANYYMNGPSVYFYFARVAEKNLELR